ncbi:hypothetical protein SERLA73DRAFT_180202 [Serpula lacrymans var. lacrymans S7.3]|uniref:Uncharacterized protein n=1 Tax=Serpula lacrymans var. lacrymans (strain S7.3) TaxID=936435 RepID=F8PW46_SERL3|nr:hypothetical protein SERLA73DRAFT_180202 [Serpula lacrymans var. lacrymans S7.3]
MYTISILLRPVKFFRSQNQITIQNRQSFWCSPGPLSSYIEFRPHRPMSLDENCI